MKLWDLTKKLTKIVIQCPKSLVRIVPPTLNMAYMYLKENVSQAFRKASCNVYKLC